MIEILHYVKDPKEREYYGMFLVMGNAGFISSTVSSKHFVITILLTQRLNPKDPESLES